MITIFLNYVDILTKLVIELDLYFVHKRSYLKVLIYIFSVALLNVYGNNKKTTFTNLKLYVT